MILITGASGFIGQNLVRSLKDKDLVLIDKGEKSEICTMANNVEFYDYKFFIDDLEKNPKLQAFLKDNVKIILHQGACTDTTNYDVGDMMFHNYEYSRRLFDFARTNNIRFIYASSAATYGHGKKGFVEDAGCEDPLNIYGRSKHAFDEYVRCYLENPTAQIVGIRYFNVYGPGESAKGKMASVIHQFYNQYKDSKEIRVFKGSDTFFRDFIHVDDIVKLNKFFIDNEDVSGVYNGGSGLQRSFADIASVFKERYSDLKIRLIDFPDDLRTKYQKNTKADMLKLFCAGYNTNSDKFISLEDGVNSYLDILEKNENSIC
jgi:ADP-L-glycero-D-manno-heptose 6-epimerase